MYEGYLKRDDSGFATKAVNGGYEPGIDDVYGGVVPPITLSTSYKQDGDSINKGFVYSRFGNPGRRMLEDCLASLDNANHALCFASGLSATTAVINLLSPGDHVVAGDELYGGSYRLLNQVAGKFNIQTTFVDPGDPEGFEKAITENTKLIWLETPTNPLLKLADITQIAKIAHKHSDIIVAVDNTFLTPYFQRPLSLGADLVMYSLTKYMNGHADVLMGSIATNDKQLYERLKFVQNIMGMVPAPFDCYMVQRSLKTLPLRMDQHMKNSIAVGLYLESHPQVQKVFHPALPSHRQHELLKKQCYGYSGMVAFYVKGNLEHTQVFLKSLKVIRWAGSLGNCSTLAIIPAIMTHTAISAEERIRLGITDNLIRMTVGLESTEDLIADIAQAFEVVAEVQENN